MAERAELAARLLALLPQTQCTRCGYPDCAAYAQAIAAGEAAINQCPPGGAQGIARLAALTGQTAIPLNPAHGTESPRSLAVIDENWCIGCTLCIKACPTDAIVGASKRMHTVIEAYCTGCELCLPACPVDCITMEPQTDSATGWDAWSDALADQARARYARHQARTHREAQEQAAQREEKARAKLSNLAAHSRVEDPEILDRKRAIIEAAMARARQKRLPPPEGGAAG